MPAYTYVDQADRIQSRIDPYDTISVDTEFMREKTFFAQLCLIQISTPDEIFCVDPLSGNELADFWTSLCARQWVAHSARQDIEVIYQSAGQMPKQLFDTQVAAGLLGYQPQLGYAGLVKELFDVELPKTHTRANWARRPLPDEFLEYAAEDVEYLLPACEILTERLRDKGRLEWAIYDSSLLLDPTLYEIDPSTAVQRLKGTRNFRGARRAAAASLAAWRESEALERNLPRQWIIRDTVLTDIAYRLPGNQAELESIEGLSAKVVQRAGAEILQQVEAARAADPATAAPHRGNSGPPDEAQKAQLKAMQKLVAACASELGLAAETIASKKELTSILLSGNRESRVFSGWRNDLIGKRLLELL